jgi:hypothetical protein
MNYLDNTGNRLDWPNLKVVLQTSYFTRYKTP